MAAEQFSLCWNNFHSNLSNGFHSLYQQEDFVDVTLAAEGRYLKAHKMVLSVCSQYFKELFQVNPCKHPIVILKDVSYNALRDLLQFMYLGEVSVSQEELSNLMKVAELLQIKGLTDENMDSMNQNGIKNMNVTDVKSLSIDTRTLLKRSKSKKAKLDKCETPAKIAKSNVSPECHEGDVQSTSSRLEAEADDDEETGSQSPPPPSLLVEPELLLEPIITPKTEPADEPSDACDYSEHSIPEMDMATMLDTNLGETSSQTAWKIESQKIYQPSDANTQETTSTCLGRKEIIKIPTKDQRDHKKHTNTLDDVVNNQLAMLAKLERLEGMFKDSEQKSRNTLYPPENLPVQLPLNTLEEFANFDRYLGNQNNFIAMSTFLKSYTSSNLGISITNVMKEIMKDEVASSINFFGKGTKTRFSNTNLDKLLFNISRTASKCTREVYKAHVMKWLKYAPQRNKYYRNRTTLEMELDVIEDPLA